MADGRAWGVQHGYHDIHGHWHEASGATVGALLDAMGAGGREPPPPVSSPPSPDCPVLVVDEGEQAEVPGRWIVRVEGGGEVAAEGALPPDLPLGYHRLVRDDGLDARLIVTPASCQPPAGPIWGWAVQLYAARSRVSWGMGDLADLARLGAWSAGGGAGMILVNPLHAAQPAGPQQASPYSPSSRVWRSPLYLRVEDVPGFADLTRSPDGVDAAEVADAGRRLNEDRLIDRDAVWHLKSAALEALWGRFRASGRDPAFDRFCDGHGSSLRSYATFCALAERHGLPWSAWPAGLRHPDGPGVAAFAAAEADRVGYHQWLQWLVDVQLARAGAAIDVVQDLAIGADPWGADAWRWQDHYALDVRVGAPPDDFAVDGQDWGLPPFDPWRLRASGYEPFVATVRALLRHGGGARIDHVMGLFRLFWIPPGRPCAEGAYVEYPWRDLLGILALESRRAGAWVVGEDLGTVEPYVREELARRHVLSYRLAWFEDTPPRWFPERAMAAVTTHDLPTIGGLWTGADLAEQERLDRHPSLEAADAMRGRLRGWSGVADDAPVDDVVRRTYESLAEAPSVVVTATLDDALGVVERPNLPGTVTERPNWCLALPVPLEDVEADPRVAAVAGALAVGRPGRAGA